MFYMFYIICKYNIMYTYIDYYVYLAAIVYTQINGGVSFIHGIGFGSGVWPNFRPNL